MIVILLLLFVIVIYNHDNHLNYYYYHYYYCVYFKNEIIFCSIIGRINLLISDRWKQIVEEAMDLNLDR